MTSAGSASESDCRIRQREDDRALGVRGHLSNHLLREGAWLSGTADEGRGLHAPHHFEQLDRVTVRDANRSTSVGRPRVCALEVTHAGGHARRRAGRCGRGTRSCAVLPPG